MVKNFIIDQGKNGVKVLVLDNNCDILDYGTILSKTEEYKVFSGEINEQDTYLLKYKGKKYKVGKGCRSAAGFSYENTKSTEHHFITVLTAIGKFVNDNDTINLILGCPTSDYDNKTEVERIEGNFKVDNGIFEIMINKKNVSFKIKSIYIYPEGMAFRPRLLADEEQLHIIDIGGFNINYRGYDDTGNSLDSYSFDHSGINSLEASFSGWFRRVIDGNAISKDFLTTKRFEEALKRGYIDKLEDTDFLEFENSGEFVIYVVNKFINELVEMLKSKGINIQQKGNIIIFTGGGSLLLKKYLKNALKDNAKDIIFSETALWDNCISYGARYIREINVDDDEVYIALLENFLDQIDSLLNVEPVM